VKKVIKPAEREEAAFFSDISGKPFGECGPPVEVKIDFNYESAHDGSSLRFHLTDEEVLEWLKALKPKLNENYKSILQAQLKAEEQKYDDSVQSRDWTSCNYYHNSTELLQFMLDPHE
jgi:hypothetical protein